MKKKFLWIFMIGIVFFVLFTLNERSYAATLDKEEINLYCVDKKLSDEFPDKLAIPDGYDTEYTVKVNGTNTPISSMYMYTRSHNDNIILASSSYVEIDKSTGKITPKLITVVDAYTHEELYQEYTYGTEIVYIKVDGQELQLKVNIIDYSLIYVEEKLQDIVDNQFNGISDYEKARGITRYVAENFDYSASYQSYRDMYLYGGGDCWASTNMINKLCELAGLKSHSRSAVYDPGAGSGHRNNAILVNGKTYIADAGYSGNKPRLFNFYLLDPAYTTKTNSDGTLTVVQYDGFESESITIPSTINGKKVTKIYRDFYTANTIHPKSITLPNTITSIGETAFYTRTGGPEYINIPASVTEIGFAAFSGCKNLELDIEPNGNFVLYNDSIYDKDKTTLIEVLDSYKGSEKYVFPSTVKNILQSAFFDIKGIKSVVLPS